MLQIALNLPAGIQNYLQTTMPDQIAAHALFAVGWIPIAGVLIWGLLQVWQDAKQGQYSSKLRWQLLQVHVPQDAVQTPKGMENFFTNIAGSKSSITWKEKWLDGKFQAWFSLEIVSIGGDIRFYIRCIEKYRDVVESALYAQYPEAQIAEVEDYTDILPEDYPNDDWDVWGSEMVLRKSTVLPIRTWFDFEHQGEKDQRFKDPLLPMLEGLGKMLPGEVFWIQMLIMQPDDQDWTKEGENEIKKAYGKEEKKKGGGALGSIGWVPGEIINQITGGEVLGGEAGSSDEDPWAAFRITPQDKERLEAIARKVSKLGWYTKVRFVYGAKNELYRKGTMASMTKGIFHQYGHLGLNKFGLHGDATPKDDYFWQVWQMPRKKKELVQRYKSRSFGTGATPFILNTEELATIFHFPAADARTPVLTSLGARRAEAPMELQFAGVDEPDLPNMQREETDVAGSFGVEAEPAPPRPLAAPRPTSPTHIGGEETGARSQESGAGLSDAFSSPQDAPIPAEQTLDENMPKPGMPAPLPPGLDLADEPIEER